MHVTHTMHLRFNIKFYLWPMWLGACYGFNIHKLGFYFFSCKPAHTSHGRLQIWWWWQQLRCKNLNSRTMNYNNYVHMFNTLVFKLQQKKTLCNNGKVWCKTLSQKNWWIWSQNVPSNFANQMGMASFLPFFD